MVEYTLKSLFMEISDAIYQRRAVRNYTDTPVAKATFNELINAAVQAPSFLNKQPWAFAVFQGKERLLTYSTREKAEFLRTEPADFGYHDRTDALDDSSFNLFYNASALVVIYATSAHSRSAEDCCLAAQNLMLAAHGLGLATCPIGVAGVWLNLPEVKNELGIPHDFTAVFPLTVGYAAVQPPPTTRNAPVLVTWQ